MDKQNINDINLTKNDLEKISATLNYLDKDNKYFKRAQEAITNNKKIQDMDIPIENPKIIHK
jgi:hypothetical protein